jgi:hypothetical protein
MHSFFFSWKACDRINEPDVQQCWRIYLQLLNCILFFLKIHFSLHWKSICSGEAILRSLFSNTLWLVCVTGIGTTVSNEHLSPPSNSLPVVSSHKISNLHFLQIFSLVFSLHASLLFPLTSHLDKLLCATSYQNVLESWLMWEETSPDNSIGSQPHISVLI